MRGLGVSGAFPGPGLRQARAAAPHRAAPALPRGQAIRYTAARGAGL